MGAGRAPLLLLPGMAVDRATLGPAHPPPGLPLAQPEAPVSSIEERLLDLEIRIEAIDSALHKTQHSLAIIASRLGGAVFPNACAWCGRPLTELPGDKR